MFSFSSIEGRVGNGEGMREHPNFNFGQVVFAVPEKESSSDVT